MAASKLMIFCTKFLVLTVVSMKSSRADLAPEEGPEFSLKVELDQIKSRISSLESTIDERTHELRSKDESIIQMEKKITEKSNSIALLQFEIESVQRKGSLDVKYQAVKAYARAGELEKQVKTLRKEIHIQFKNKDALEAKATVAEKKILLLNSNLENLRKINDEQNIRIRTTERALRLAEKEIMKAKLESTSLAKVLKEVHGAWLPPWFAVHFGDLQSFILTHWNSRGRPAFGLIIQEVLDKMGQAEKWVQPYIETVKTIWNLETCMSATASRQLQRKLECSSLQHRWWFSAFSDLQLSTIFLSFIFFCCSVQPNSGVKNVPFKLPTQKASAYQDSRMKISFIFLVLFVIDKVVVNDAVHLVIP